MAEKDGGKVRWRELVPVLVTIFTLTVAISWGIIYLHSQGLHQGAVSNREFDRLTQTMDRQFATINRKLDDLSSKVGNPGP